jgi:hypothetical protein
MRAALWPGATVFLFDTSNNVIAQEAMTDASGAYSLTGLPDTGDAAEEYQLYDTAKASVGSTLAVR